MLLFRRKRQYNRALCCLLCSPCRSRFRLPFPLLFRPCIKPFSAPAFAAILAQKSAFTHSRLLPFSCAFLSVKTSPCSLLFLSQGVKKAPIFSFCAYIVGFFQFQNLSTRKVAQSFTCWLRADPPEGSGLQKTFASKERTKNVFSPVLPCKQAAKNAGCMLVLPKGGGQNRSRRRHTEPNDRKRGDAHSSGYG